MLLSYGATNGAPYFGAMPRLWRTGPVPSDTGLPDWVPVTEPLLKALPRYRGSLSSISILRDGE